MPRINGIERINILETKLITHRVTRLDDGTMQAEDVTDKQRLLLGTNNSIEQLLSIAQSASQGRKTGMHEMILDEDQMYSNRRDTSMAEVLDETGSSQAAMYELAVSPMNKRSPALSKQISMSKPMSKTVLM